MIWSHWKGWKGEESGVRYCDDSSLYVYDGGDPLAFIEVVLSCGWVSVE